MRRRTPPAPSSPSRSARTAGVGADRAARAEQRAQQAREPQWALERRRAGIHLAGTLGFPSRLDELWRRTDFRTLESAIPGLDPLVPGSKARNVDDLPT